MRRLLKNKKIAVLLIWAMIISLLPLEGLSFAKAAETFILDPAQDVKLLAIPLDSKIPNGNYGPNGFFTIYSKESEEKNVVKFRMKEAYYVEVPKSEYGYIEFTMVSSGNVVLNIGSTGASNVSDIALKKADGGFVTPDGASTTYASVTGVTGVDVSFSNLPAGTYKIVVPTKDRATRIYSARIMLTGEAVITFTPTPTATNTPAPTNTPTPRPIYNGTGFTKVISDAAEADCVYVSANGKANAAGTKADPMELQAAINKAEAGKPIILLAGTYKPENFISIARGNDGTPESMKMLMAERGGRAVLDFTNSKGTEAAFTLAGNYWYIGGLDIVGAPNYGTGSSKKGAKGMKIAGSHNVVDSCNAYNNHNTGFQVSRYASSDTKEQWPSYNLIVNCDSHDNKDDPCEDADGFAAKLTCGEGNVFLGCISYCNIDDGWDLYAKSETGSIGVVTIKNCVAMKNGWLSDGSGSGNGDGNGFKLGSKEFSTHHMAENCIAIGNLANGFDSNGNGGIRVFNCTSYKNGKAGYTFRDDSKPLDAEGSGLISLGNTSADTLKSNYATSMKTALNYLWDKKSSKNSAGDTITESYFKSTDLSNIPGRDANYNIVMDGVMEIKEYAGVGAVLEYEVYNFSTKSASGSSISGWTSQKTGGAAVATPSPAPTAAATSTPSPVPTAAATFTPSPVPTVGATPTAIPAATEAVTPTATATPTETVTPTATENPEVSNAPTNTPEVKPTEGEQPSVTPVPTVTQGANEGETTNSGNVNSNLLAFIIAFLGSFALLAIGFIVYYVYKKKKI